LRANGRNIAPTDHQDGRELRASVMALETKRRPRSPPIWDRILDRFILTANKSRLHENDWRWFYEFVRRNRARMSSKHLKSRLIEGGFSADYALEIICTYELLRWCTRPMTPAEILTLHKIKHPQEDVHGVLARLRL
jgi:hypothetical protein